MDILNEDPMASYDEEKGGNDLLVKMAVVTVAGESGISIKFSRAYSRRPSLSLVDSGRHTAASHALGTFNKLRTAL